MLALQRAGLGHSARARGSCRRRLILAANEGSLEQCGLWLVFRSLILHAVAYILQYLWRMRWGLYKLSATLALACECRGQ